jgi:hypothetical protein
MLRRYIKDPAAVLDYAVDWRNPEPGEARGYLDDDETITAHEVTVDDGITKDSDSETDGVVTIWLSGGAAGQRYTIGCKITTSAGRIDERSFEVDVKQR